MHRHEFCLSQIFSFIIIYLHTLCHPNVNDIMSPTALCGGEGDIQGLRGVESKLERCQLATGNMNVQEYDAKVGTIERGVRFHMN